MAWATRVTFLLLLLSVCTCVRVVGADGAAPATGPTADALALKPVSGGPAVVISLAGEINDYSRNELFRRFEHARRLGAKTVILEIDTYGGFVTSGLEISGFIKRQNDIHTIAFVKDKAISAGAMIAVACDEIVMAPSTTLGDCAPIVFDTGGRLEPLPTAERAKQESPVINDFRDSATRNHYDPLLLVSMVNVETVVYYVQDGRGHKRFVDAAEYKELTADPDWKPVAGLKNPVDDEKSLLTVHTSEALALGLATGEAVSPEALASQRGYSILAALAPTAGDRIIVILSSPYARAILLTIFIQALVIGLGAPGHGAAEAIAVVSLGLLVGVPLLTGYAQWWHLLLIFAGLAFVAFEIFVFPGHFVSAIVGVIMVLGGLLLTFVGDASTAPDGWRLPGTWAGLERGVYVIAGGLFSSVLLSLWLRRYLPRLPYFNGLILTTTSGGGTLAADSASRSLPSAASELSPSSSFKDAAVTADHWPFIGTSGRAVSDLKPGGSAAFPYADDTRTTTVISDGDYIVAGTKVVVREVRGNRVVVRGTSA